MAHAWWKNVCVTVLLSVFVTLLVWSAAASTEIEKVPAEVLTQVATDGKVLVLVGLNVPWRMETTLTESGIMAQRQAIGVAQDSLLAELSGTQFKLVRLYEAIPSVALEVGADALVVLKTSDSVTNVLPDRPTKPAISPSIIEGTPSSLKIDEGTAGIGAVPAELFLEATHAGAVLVLVGLKTPWSPEGPLSKEMVAVQREAIAAAQNYLLTELADTKYRITRRYEVIPGIALEVGLDALRVLARSAAVTNVLRDRPAVKVR
jgi:hypothetical protein